MNSYREQQQPMAGMAGDNGRGRVLFNKAHSVWMGDVEPFMTEEFLRKQFTELGLNVVNVRIMHSNKFQDQNITYAFIELDDERTAIRTVQRYNDKPLPGDSRRKFRLNFTCQSQIKQAQDENGLFVGELSPDVDDLALYSTFQERYPSVKWAKVIKDHSGMSKGFGFVKFNHDEEYAKALQEMNGYQGLGANPIRVSQATPKERKNNQQHGGGGGGGQWGGGGGPSHHPNPMVAQHQQQMQYFNQATAGFQSQADYYSYYYPQAAAASGPAAAMPNYYAAQLHQQYYDQQFRHRQDTARVSSQDGHGGQQLSHHQQQQQQPQHHQQQQHHHQQQQQAAALTALASSNNSSNPSYPAGYYESAHFGGSNQSNHTNTHATHQADF